MSASALPFLRETLLFLALAGVLIPLLQRWRINPVLGFMTAGAVLGPLGLGRWIDAVPMVAYATFRDIESLSQLAELGVLFLMFMIGLELSLSRLWALRYWVWGAGGAQWLATGLGLALCGRILGLSWPLALVVGLMLALSSTAWVMHRLMESRTVGSPLGQACLAILTLQDLAVVPLLLLIDAMKPQSGLVAEPALLATFQTLGWALAKAVVAVALIAWVGRRVLRPGFLLIGRRHQPDVFMALTLLVTLSMAGLTSAAGVSMALGALLAGVLLAETEYRHEVHVTIEPFRGLLMGLFFMVVGMGIDLRAVIEHAPELLLALAGLFVVKGLILVPILRWGGLSRDEALHGGVLLGQGGEFALIALGVATHAGVVSAELGRFVGLVVLLSLYVTPLALRLLFVVQRVRAPGASLDGAAAPSVNPPPPQGYVVIAGFGRVGQLVAAMLRAEGVPYWAIDSDAQRVTSLRERGAQVWFGNASHGDLLAQFHIAQALAVVVTMDEPAASLRAVKAIRHASATVPVMVRARDAVSALTLREAGATRVIPETLEVSLQLAAGALTAAGLQEGLVLAAMDAERARQLEAVSRHEVSERA